MTKLRERNSELEDRAVRHAARIEELEDTEARLRRRIRVLETEAAARADIIRRRNAQITELSQQAAAAGLALGRLLLAQRAPGPLDTGTPGVEVSGR